MLVSDIINEDLSDKLVSLKHDLQQSTSPIKDATNHPIVKELARGLLYQWKDVYNGISEKYNRVTPDLIHDELLIFLKDELSVDPTIGYQYIKDIIDLNQNFNSNAMLSSMVNIVALTVIDRIQATMADSQDAIGYGEYFGDPETGKTYPVSVVNYQDNNWVKFNGDWYYDDGANLSLDTIINNNQNISQLDSNKSQDTYMRLIRLNPIQLQYINSKNVDKMTKKDVISASNQS